MRQPYLDIEIDTGLETKMHNSYGRKTQYPAIQQPQQWQQQQHNTTNSRNKYRYHDVPAYAVDTSNNYPTNPTATVNNNGMVNDPRKNMNSADITKNDFKVKKKFDLIRWFKRHPLAVMVFSYLCIFAIGITVGFIPFITLYMRSCQEDREMIEGLKNILQNPVNMSSSSFPVTSQVSSGPWSKFVQGSSSGNSLDVGKGPVEYADILTYIQSLSPKRAIGTGNDDIELKCTGNINILSVRYRGVLASKKSLSDVREYCKDRATMVKNNNQCVVSLKRVYDDGYPDDAVTEIYYKCY